MKNIKIVLSLLLATTLSLSSCEDFDELNTDPNRMSSVTPGALLNPVLYDMAVFNWGRARSWTFELMQVSLSTLSSSGVGQYNFNDNAGNSTWNNHYRWLNNLREMEQLAIELQEPNYRAIALTLKAYSLHQLTDAFGPVPMTEAVRGDEGLMQPAFDSQEAIYPALLQILEEANALYNTEAGLRFNTDGEFLFGTDNSLTNGVSPGIIKWKKFTNSLRLRIALRMSNADEGKARSEVENILTNPGRYPIFTSNEEAALLPISGVFPQEAPMARPQDFTAYKGMTSFFIGHLNDWNDPRRPIFSTPVNGEFLGWPSGYAVAPTQPASPSNLNQNLAKAPLKIAILPYAEVAFIQAEAAFRGWNTGGLSAQEAYEAGVTAAMEQWGAEVPEDYFGQTLTAYDGSLERIMLQKYYALFFCDYQQWYEHLRTGLPALTRGDGVPAGNPFPTRFKYPEIIQRTNLQNYQSTINQLGGDDFDNKLWYQK